MARTLEERIKYYAELFRSNTIPVSFFLCSLADEMDNHPVADVLDEVPKDLLFNVRWSYLAKTYDGTWNLPVARWMKDNPETAEERASREEWERMVGVKLGDPAE